MVANNPQNSQSSQTPQKRPNPPPIRRDWLGKTLAGIVLGAVLAFFGSALFVQLNPDLPLAVRGQLAMWMVAPLWLSVLGGVYFFSSGARAWGSLTTLCILVAGAFYALRLS